MALRSCSLPRGANPWLALVFAAVISLAAAASAQEGAGTVAVVSDIHFDPFDPPALARQLAAIPANDWPTRFAANPDQRLSRYGEDTNHALLASSMAALAKTAAAVDFVIVAGDLLAHQFEKKAAAALDVPEISGATGDFAVRTTIFVAEAVAGAVPGKAVILALGNNDSGCGDYRIEPGGSYLAATRETVRRLAGAARVESDFATSYSAGGYYAVRHPTVEKTVVIVLNDVLWSADYRNACGTDGLAAADSMLAWLRERLRRAREAGEHVWLVHHVPWGIDPYSTLHANAARCAEKIVPFLKQPYASAFVSLLRQYGDLVRASLSGHVHYDDYRLLLDDRGNAIGVDKVVAAISPIFGQNPAFQILDYDRTSARPTDFSVFYLANLDTAENPTAADWRREYTFSEAYQQPGYSARAVKGLWGMVSQGGWAAEAFRKFYPVSRGDLHSDVLPAYACAIGHLDERSFRDCFCGG
jgi:hypothetical protein